MTSAASVKSVKKMPKELKSLQKAMTQLQSVNNSETALSISNSTNEHDFHMQFFIHNGFQFSTLNEHFDSDIRLVFNQAESKKIKLDLREVILLDSQSTIDLLCNYKLVRKIFKSNSTMTLRSNGCTMTVTKKAKISGYKKHVWFSKKAITNIVSLRNIIQQYRVTYDSHELKFIVHRDKSGKPNIEFCMHENGLHYFDPLEHNNVVFINTVSNNRHGFTRRQVKDAKAARMLYATLRYPSIKDFK